MSNDTTNTGATIQLRNKETKSPIVSIFERIDAYQQVLGFDENMGPIYGSDGEVFYDTSEPVTSNDLAKPEEQHLYYTYVDDNNKELTWDQVEQYEPSYLTPRDKDFYDQIIQFSINREMFVVMNENETFTVTFDEDSEFYKPPAVYDDELDAIVETMTDVFQAILQKPESEHEKYYTWVIATYKKLKPEWADEILRRLEKKVTDTHTADRPRKAYYESAGYEAPSFVHIDFLPQLMPQLCLVGYGTNTCDNVFTIRANSFSVRKITTL